MAFEYDDRKIKSTMLITRLDNGKYRLYGFVRFTDANGNTTLRLTQNIDNSVVFDDVEFVPETPDANTELGLTKFQDWGVRTA